MFLLSSLLLNLQVTYYSDPWTSYNSHPYYETVYHDKIISHHYKRGNSEKLVSDPILKIIRREIIV